MNYRLLLSTAAFIWLLPGHPSADVGLPVIEYRVLGPIGQVRLTTGVVHDEDTQRAMLGRLMSFDQQGLILIAGDSVREFRRRETIGSHSVETTIHVYPATGRGYRGGLATADIIVTVDGKKRIDCPYVSGAVELADVGILPVDGMISVSGSYGAKHIGELLLLSAGQLIDSPWLQRHAK